MSKEKDRIELDQLSADQAADLAALTATANEQAAIPTPEEQEAEESRAASIAGAALIVKTARKGLETFIPALFAGAGDEAWDGIAEPLAETIEYYGLDVPAVFDHPLAKLGFACLPVGGLAFVRYQALKAEAQKKAPPPAIAPGAASVTIGAAPQETVKSSAGVTFGAPIPA